MYDDNNTDFDAIADEILFRLISRHSPFSKEDFFKLAREHSMPPRFMLEIASETFCQFEKLGYIERDDNGLWKAAEEEP